MPAVYSRAPVFPEAGQEGGAPAKRKSNASSLRFLEYATLAGCRNPDHPSLCLPLLRNRGLYGHAGRRLHIRPSATGYDAHRVVAGPAPDPDYQPAHRNRARTRGRRERPVTVERLALLRYRRIAKRAALEHETRTAIYDHIRAHPGIRLGTLAEDLGINRGGTLRYHLGILQEFGMVAAAAVGGRRDTSRTGRGTPPLEAKVLIHLKNPNTRDILFTLLEEPGRRGGTLPNGSGSPPRRSRGTCGASQATGSCSGRRAGRTFGIPSREIRQRLSGSGWAAVIRRNNFDGDEVGGVPGRDDVTRGVFCTGASPALTANSASAADRTVPFTTHAVEDENVTLTGGEEPGKPHRMLVCTVRTATLCKHHARPARGVRCRRRCTPNRNRSREAVPISRRGGRAVAPRHPVRCPAEPSYGALLLTLSLSDSSYSTHSSSASFPTAFSAAPIVTFAIFTKTSG